jgi:hypothetical protein
MLTVMGKRIALALVVLFSACGSDCPETEAEILEMYPDNLDCGVAYDRCVKTDRGRQDCADAAIDCLNNSVGSRASCFREIGNEGEAEFSECDLLCRTDFYICDSTSRQFCGDKQIECFRSCGSI